MAEIRSYGALMNKLQEARDKALAKAGEESVKISKDIIDQVVYNAGSPANYQRTYQLKNSFRDNPLENKGSVAVVRLDHDKGQISANPSNFQHASPYWSPWDYSGYVAKTVHDGGSGGLFGDGYWRASRPYIPEITKTLEGGVFKQLMLAQLRGMGLNAK